jgi:hypothetical protein
VSILKLEGVSLSFKENSREVSVIFPLCKMSTGIQTKFDLSICLEVLTLLANAEIARSDVVTWVRTQDLTVVCGFNFSGLPIHLRQKKLIYLRVRLLRGVGLRKHVSHFTLRE